MSILSDRQIHERCIDTSKRLVLPHKSEIISGRQVEEILRRAGEGPTAFDIKDLTPEEAAKFSPMIIPFVPGQVRHEGEEKVISYGTSSYGYDIRLAPEFKIFTNVNSTLVNPKDFDEQSFVSVEGDSVIIPPNSFILARSIEWFNMPRDVTGLVLAKSTYARCGCSCLATPLEAGWSGHITLEFANTTPLPMKMFANEGCAQVLFFQGSEPPMVSYADRAGKYQGQTGITLPRA